MIGSDGGLSPGWRQAIIWTNAGILLLEPWEQISVKSEPNKFFSFEENGFKNDSKLAAIFVLASMC